MPINPQHTLGFFAGGFRNVAQFKGVDLGPWSAVLDRNRTFKSIVVGLDAADWQVIDPLMQAGKLPTITEFLQGGVRSNLATLDPPISPMLWTTIATGQWPSAHGIHGFTELYNGAIRAVRQSSVRVSSYWHYLEAAGMPATVVGWWPSHPSEPSDLGGIRISNLALSELGQWLEDGVLPESLIPLANSLLIHPEEIPAPAVAQFFPNQDLDSTDDIVRSVLKVLTHAINAHTMATLALEAAAGGHASIYYDALDHFMHVGMRYHPPQLPGISNADFTRYRFIVEAAYRLHDLFLGKILEHITPESHAILLSDHGFASGDDRLIQLPGHAGAPALEHRFYGVFAARGPRFKDAEGFTGLSLLDMAPTVLASCGIAPTTSMVGRVPAGLRQYELSAPAELVRQTSQKGTSRPDLEAEMLENLVALGYLDRADTTTQHGRLAENVYYAARSLRAEGKLEGARTMMQPLMELGEVPERYALLMASVLSELQNWPALKVVVKRFGSKQSDLYLWRYFDQLIRLSEGQRLELPIGLNERARGALVVLWGRLLAKAGKWTELDALLEGKPSETPDILNLNMRLALAREQWSEALEYALKSTEILYHQPTVHGALAMLFAKLGMPEQAVVAKAVALKMQPVRAGKPLVVVTGPPRSGTSLAMQLLEAVGIEAVSDGVRSADGHNERGYFEHEKVKQWTLDAAWLEQQSGRAIKIVEPLLVQAPLPDVPIVVIRMDRELNSVMRSQRAMKGNEQVPMGLLERQRWERAKAELIDFADVRGDMQVFHWSYEALMAGEIEQVMGEAMAVLHATLDLDVNWTNLKALIMPELRHF